MHNYREDTTEWNPNLDVLSIYTHSHRPTSSKKEALTADKEAKEI